jgi:23S rRNA (uracil1939-C5)-methyltransferase
MKEFIPGEKFQLGITDLNQHGQGVGRINDFVLFVDGGVPGDVIEAELISVSKNYGVASLKRILSSSGDRTDPPCPIFSVCGGCSLQAMSYQAQITWKRRKVIEQLERIGKIDNAGEITSETAGMNEPWRYRAKVQIPVGGTSTRPEIGFYKRRSHQIADSSACLIQNKAADLVRQIVREFISEFKIEPYCEESHKGLLRHIIVRAGFYSNQIMVILVINGRDLPKSAILKERLSKAISSNGLELTSLYLNINTKRGNVVMGKQNILLAGKPYIEELLLGLTYRISPGAFFQVNPSQTEVLYKIVLEMAELQGTETVLDLYCGAGSISLLLAQKAAHVIGVEIVGQAIEDARTNALLNKCVNTLFIEAAAEAWLPEYAAGSGVADLLVLDPPRKGCDRVLIDAVLAANVPRIIYVSCNPATLARDLSLLAQKYSVERIVPVDMFPHSDHVETVVLMSRQNT